MPLADIILVIMGMLTVAMLVAAACRSLPVPHAVVLVVLGLFMGWLARHEPAFNFLLSFSLTPEIVLFLFLPVLVFESAFNLDARELIKDIAPVVTLAVPALIVSTAIIGTGLWWLFDLDLTLMLLFGALISATDPVAVIALFKELGAPDRLTTLIEGESLFNDATAIVLFNTLLTLAMGGALIWSDAGYATVDFIRVFVGGALLGIVMGFVISMILNRVHAGYSGFLIMSVVMAYISFILAEHVLHLSGVMAVVGSALVLAAYGVARIPQETSQSIRDVWEVLAMVSNALLFLLVGLSIDVAALNVDWILVLAAVLLVLAARAMTIYGLLPGMLRLFGLPHVAVAERHIMWWGGLKGGLAIAMALTIPEDMAGRGLVLDLTLAVVLFSLLLNAPTVRPLIIRLGLNRMSEDDAAEWRLGLQHGRNSANRFLTRLRQADLLPDTVDTSVQQVIDDTFNINDNDVIEQQRQIRAQVLREEMAVLRELYAVGLVKPYIFMDLRNMLRRDAEGGLSHQHKSEAMSPSLFQRIESWGLTHLREKDWASHLLSRYQKLRLSLRLERDIAGLMMAGAAIDVLKSGGTNDSSDSQPLLSIYEDRYERRLKRIQQVAYEYPDYYSKSLERMALQTSMTAAWEGLEEEHHHGAIGAKAFDNLQKRIQAVLHDLPVVPPPHMQGVAELVDKVPLLHGLSDKVRDEIVTAATLVTFLPGDQVIAEDQRGDALYLILTGKVVVTRKGKDNSDSVLAELMSGDFFGEAALLEDSVRTASVRAGTMATLIRIPRREVLRIAAEQPELQQRLEETASERQEAGMAVPATPAQNRSGDVY